MRVLAFAHSAVLRAYRERWRILAGRGHEVHLVSPASWTEGNRVVAFEGPPDPRLAVTLTRPWGASLPTARLRNVAHLPPGLPGLIRAAAPEVIEVFEEPYSLAAWAVFRAAARTRPGALRLVFSAQNIAKRFPWPFRRFEARVLADADGAMPVDPLVTPVLRAKGLRAPAEVVALGIDPDFFRPVPPDPALVGPGDAPGPRLGYFGKLQPEKGVGMLAELLPELPPGTELLVAGAGPMAGRLRGRPGVRVLGPLPQARLPGFLAACDVVAIPSRTTAGWKEQFGRAAIEAMACGRAVVVSDSGSLPYVVGDAAAVVPEGDEGAWVETLSALLTSKERREAVAAKARPHVLARYTWGAIADAHERAWAAAAGWRARSEGPSGGPSGRADGGAV